MWPLRIWVLCLSAEGSASSSPRTHHLVLTPLPATGWCCIPSTRRSGSTSERACERGWCRRGSPRERGRRCCGACSSPRSRRRPPPAAGSHPVRRRRLLRLAPSRRQRRVSIRTRVEKKQLTAVRQRPPGSAGTRCSTCWRSYQKCLRRCSSSCTMPATLRQQRARAPTPGPPPTRSGEVRGSTLRSGALRTCSVCGSSATPRSPNTRFVRRMRFDSDHQRRGARNHSCRVSGMHWPRRRPTSQWAARSPTHKKVGCRAPCAHSSDNHSEAIAPSGGATRKRIRAARQVDQLAEHRLAGTHARQWPGRTRRVTDPNAGPGILARRPGRQRVAPPHDGTDALHTIEERERASFCRRSLD
jgi:hypothetical protein